MTLLGEAAYTARRYPVGSRTNHRYNPGTPTTYTLRAVFQPIPRGEDLIIEGLERTVDAKMGWTENQDVRTLNEDEPRAADEVQIDGEWYEVMRIQRWPLLSTAHVQMIVRRRERQ